MNTTLGFPDEPAIEGVPQPAVRSTPSKATRIPALIMPLLTRAHDGRLRTNAQGIAETSSRSPARTRRAGGAQATARPRPSGDAGISNPRPEVIRQPPSPPKSKGP